MRKSAYTRFGTRVVALMATLVLVAAPAAAVPPSPALPAAGADIQTPLDPSTQEFRDQLAAKQAELDVLEAELEELDRQLAIAAEAYNEAAFDLESTTERLDRTKTDLANAEAAFQIQQDTLSERARDLYRDGELSSLQILLDAKSVSDLVGRLKFLHSIGRSDADIAAELEAQRDQIAATAAELEDKELKARSLEFELQARQIEVLLRIQEREALLATAQADLLAMLEAQASERQKAEAELLRQVLSGVSSAGISVEPGSPVETALGYHGVPYLWGGETPSGFDCSGLVLYVYRQHSVSLPHYSGAQFQLGEKVAPADLESGDVVFFGSPVYHVGIYVGGGYFIHAPRTGDFVKLSRLAERSDYAGARRYDWSYRTSPIADQVTNPASAIQ